VDLATRDNTAVLSVPQVENDTRLIEAWLHGRPGTTQRGYRRDAYRFLDFAQKPLQRVTLPDLQAFSDTLQDTSPNSRKTALSAIRSLLTFGHKLGYLPVNIGATLKLPKAKNTLAERILPESAIQRMIALETNPRNYVLLRLLYATGGRVSEICALKWKDSQPTDSGGQITIYGKGGKTRAVIVPAESWQYLMKLRGKSKANDPVFRSRKGGHLDASQVWRIVGAAAKRAGIDAPVSPHWFRHAHASHALDKGCPVHLVSSTLGHASIAITSVYAHVRPGESSGKYLAI
jgi:integrase/recombinase XerD